MDLATARTTIEDEVSRPIMCVAQCMGNEMGLCPERLMDRRGAFRMDAAGVMAIHFGEDPAESYGISRKHYYAC
ncbi:MAG: hypothetical protein V2B18_12845 [Pseudomonadota bacterium]